MGWIRGAPSKRRINGRLSVTRTAFPTSNAATVAVKKPLKSMPCSSRIKRLVHRIRLKPMKKKIVGGSACRICTSHQSRARRGNDTGAETETLGWLTPYLPNIVQSHGHVYAASSNNARRINVHQTAVVFKHA